MCETLSEDFDEWRVRVNTKFTSHTEELIAYLTQQLMNEESALNGLAFSSPILGLLNYLYDHQPRIRILLTAYLSLVQIGDDVPAQLLIAGQRLKVPHFI